MTDADRSAFAAVLFALGDTFDAAISDTRMEIYFRALVDLPLEAVTNAAVLHMRHGKFFPRPVELREAVDGSLEDRAEVAWTQLLRLVRKVGSWGKPDWPDPVLERAAKELYGGWAMLCERLPGEGPELLGAAKLFKSTYAAYARREAREALSLPTTDEARARLHGLRDDLESRGLPAPGLPQ